MGHCTICTPKHTNIALETSAPLKKQMIWCNTKKHIRSSGLTTLTPLSLHVFAILKTWSAEEKERTGGEPEQEKETAHGKSRAAGKAKCKFIGGMALFAGII